MSLYCSYVKRGWNPSKPRILPQCELGHFQIRANSVMFLKDMLPDFNTAIPDPRTHGWITNKASTWHVAPDPQGPQKFQVHCMSNIFGNFLLVIANLLEPLK